MTIAVLMLCLLAALIAILGFLPLVLHRATREIKTALWMASFFELLALCGLIAVTLTFNKETLPGGVAGVGLIAILIIPVPFVIVYWYRFQYQVLLGLYHKVADKSK